MSVMTMTPVMSSISSLADMRACPISVATARGPRGDVARRAPACDAVRDGRTRQRAELEAVPRAGAHEPRAAELLDQEALAWLDRVEARLRRLDAVSLEVAQGAARPSEHLNGFALRWLAIAVGLAA